MAVMRVLLLLALMVPGVAFGQAAYPSRPIRMIVPLAAGSSVDNAARIITQKMSESMGQQIVILNQSGAAGVIGAGEVARAAPDGYTIGGFNDSVLTMLPATLAKLPWDPVRSFAPVSLVGTIEFGLVANNAVRYSDAAGLIAAARGAPDTITYGSGGIGSPQHIAMVIFAQAAGISLRHIPYRGATQAATDVVAGQVDVSFQGLPVVAGLVRGGQMKLLGVGSAERLAQFPEAPTIGASGLPGFTFSTWFGVVVPAGTPEAVVERLNAEIVKAVGDAGVREKLVAQGFVVRGSTAGELRDVIAAQLVKYAAVVKAAGITPGQ
jgi:tripartite-type tricarboxylate transporter receptor subunit TctC